MSGEVVCIDIYSANDWEAFVSYPGVKDAISQYADLFVNERDHKDQLQQTNQLLKDDIEQLHQANKLLLEQEKQIMEQLQQANKLLLEKEKQIESIGLEPAKQRNNVTTNEIEMILRHFTLDYPYLYPKTFRNEEFQTDSWKCFEYNKALNSFEKKQLKMVSSNELCVFYSGIIPLQNASHIFDAFSQQQDLPS